MNRFGIGIVATLLATTLTYRYVPIAYSSVVVFFSGLIISLIVARLSERQRPADNEQEPQNQEPENEPEPQADQAPAQQPAQPDRSLSRAFANLASTLSITLGLLVAIGIIVGLIYGILGLGQSLKNNFFSDSGEKTASYSPPALLDKPLLLDKEFKPGEQHHIPGKGKPMGIMIAGVTPPNAPIQIRFQDSDQMGHWVSVPPHKQGRKCFWAPTPDGMQIHPTGLDLDIQLKGKQPARFRVYSCN